MALSCGIVGLPNVGKSTIFNALTPLGAAFAANYPFATIEPNVGEVAVPDDRLSVLAEIVDGADASSMPPMRFVDIAGLVRGASSGEGLGNAFLSHIRETDAIAMVVRCFEDADVHPRRGLARPGARRRDRRHRDGARRPCDDGEARGQARTRGPHRPQARADSSTRPSACARRWRKARRRAPSRRLRWNCDAGPRVLLLTAKPLLYVANVDEEQIGKPGPLARSVFEHRRARRAAGRSPSAARSRPNSPGSPKTRPRLPHGAGHRAQRARPVDPGRLRPARPDDVPDRRRERSPGLDDRPRHEGSPSRRHIHSDIERGFIRAEIVSYDDYARLRTMEALQGRRPASAARARNTSCRRATSSTSASTCERCGRFRLDAGANCAHRNALFLR